MDVPSPMSEPGVHQGDRIFDSIIKDLANVGAQLARLFPIGLAAIITILGGAYLIAIPLGLVGNNRLGPTEVALLAILLLFNSGFLEKAAPGILARLTRFSLGGGGLDVQLQTIRVDQESQKRDIEFLQFVMASYADDTEFEMLAQLASYRAFDYDHQTEEDQKTMVKRLRRLVDRGFIKRQSGRHFGDMPRKGDVKDVCFITDQGRRYVELRQKSMYRDDSEGRR